MRSGSRGGVVLLLAAALFWGAGGCEDGPSAPSDAGSDSGHAGAHDAGPPDAGPPPPIRCSEAELAAGDRTDGGAPLEITFNTGANPKQYENRCATVKVGASVVFSGSFVQHPLEPAGGDTPSPIPYTDQEPPDGRLVVTMTRVGTFGFQCVYHPASMFGAIRVVP